MRVRVVLASWMLLCAVGIQAEEPKWLTDARAREGKIGAAKEFKSKDSWFKARVPGKVKGAVEKVENSYSIEIDFGGDSGAYCELVPDGFDMADMMRRTLELTMQQVAENQGKLESRQLEYADAGAIGNLPYLKARWLYRVNDGKELRLGQLKQFVTLKGGHGLYCAHLDIGYVKSFDAVTHSLAQTLETATGTPAPYYQEIAVATLGGMKSGIAMMTLEKDADGDTKTEEITAMMVPAAGGALHTQDAVHKEWTRPDATMINAAHFIAENGELNVSLGLKAVEETWVIEGELQGKEVSFKLPPDSEPGTWLAQSLGIRKLLAGANPIGGEYALPMWLAADPAKLTDAKTKVLAKSGASDFSARATAGAIEAAVILDKNGSVSSANMQVGAQKVSIERVFVSGSF
ncbi:MAG TPA: hypothetical protein VFO82_06950 [Steroidobacteraceae bacterium]|nr:hypothetical protein [Steroidobacteraceae bacterium]